MGAAQDRLPRDLTGEDAVATVLGDQQLVVDPRDESIAHCLLNLGQWEWWVSKAIADVMRPGVNCVDVGANAGYFVAQLKALGARRVLALEPQPALVRRLQESVRLNQWSGVEVLQLAAAEGRGTAALSIPSENNLGGSSIMVRNGDTILENVQTVALDELLADWDELHLVKLDAEGAEPRIWAGMQETIRRFPDLHVFAEMTVNHDSDPWLDEVEAAGFTLRFLDYDLSVRAFDRSRLRDRVMYMMYLHRDDPAWA